MEKKTDTKLGFTQYSQMLLNSHLLQFWLHSFSCSEFKQLSVGVLYSEYFWAVVTEFASLIFQSPIYGKDILKNIWADLEISNFNIN